MLLFPNVDTFILLLFDLPVKEILEATELRYNYSNGSGVDEFLFSIS